MNYKLFIAWRYLFSRKSHHAINIISGISACGVAIATLAMVCTLSVFNGFQSLVADLFTDFDPELKITLTESRTFSANDAALKALRNRNDVAAITNCLEDKALVLGNEKQVVVTIKGMDENFAQQMNLSRLLYPEMPDDVVLSADVLEFGDAVGDFRPFARGGQGGKQHGGEDRDDGDHDEELDERKAVIHVNILSSNIPSLTQYTFPYTIYLPLQNIQDFQTLVNPRRRKNFQN